MWCVGRFLPPIMPKRKRFDWTTKTDPDTGAVTRFCSKCQEFLPLDRFYPSTIKAHSLVCRTHYNHVRKRTKLEWARRNRGKLGSIKRARVNLNNWITKQNKAWPRWNVADIEHVLITHSIPLDIDTRLVRIRPKDQNHPFTTDNVVVERLEKNGSS